MRTISPRTRIPISEKQATPRLPVPRVNREETRWVSGTAPMTGEACTGVDSHGTVSTVPPRTSEMTNIPRADVGMRAAGLD